MSLPERDPLFVFPIRSVATIGILEGSQSIGIEYNHVCMIAVKQARFGVSAGKYDRMELPS